MLSELILDDQCENCLNKLYDNQQHDLDSPVLHALLVQHEEELIHQLAPLHTQVQRPRTETDGVVLLFLHLLLLVHLVNLLYPLEVHHTVDRLAHRFNVDLLAQPQLDLHLRRLALRTLDHQLALHLHLADQPARNIHHHLILLSGPLLISRKKVLLLLLRALHKSVLAVLLL